MQEHLPTWLLLFERFFAFAIDKGKTERQKGVRKGVDDGLLACWLAGWLACWLACFLGRFARVVCLHTNKPEKMSCVWFPCTPKITSNNGPPCRKSCKNTHKQRHPEKESQSRFALKQQQEQQTRSPFLAVVEGLLSV